jgi:hypothetical protein
MQSSYLLNLCCVQNLFDQKERHFWARFVIMKEMIQRSPPSATINNEIPMEVDPPTAGAVHVVLASSLLCLLQQ